MKKRILVLSMVLALVAALAVPTAALAAVTKTGETTVTGEVPATYTLTVPSPITMPSLVRGTTQTSDAATLSMITSETGYSVTLTVRDKKTSGAIGQMVRTDDQALTNPLKVKGGASGDGSEIVTYTALPTAAGSVLTIASGKALTADTLHTIGNFYCQQVVASGDLTGNYSLTLLFVATFST